MSTCQSTNHKHQPLARAAATTFLVMGIACSTTTSKSGPTGPGGGGGDSTGSLSVTISSPAGVTPSVTVTGPGSYAKTITSTETLAGLMVGSYAITPAVAMGPGAIVGIPYSGTVTGSPATVAAKATARATVAYAQRASEGLLLIASNGGTVTGLTAAQLASSGAPAATTSVQGKSSGLVVDATGGIWTCYAGNDTLYYYTQAQVLAGGTPTPTRTIAMTGASTSDLASVAFDNKGDLWVSDRQRNELYEFTPEQLMTSGAPTPTVTITSGIGTLNSPWGIAFDAAGDLWVVDQADSAIVGYAPTALSKGGAQVPFAGFMTAGSGFGVSIAFDSAGDLWTGGLDGTVAEYTPAQLTTVSSPTPSVLIHIGTSTIPAGLAFDASGDLWVADEAGGKLRMYTPAQLRTSGSPTPTTTITNNGHSFGLPTTIAFSPHPAYLPLH
jgi:sugar lactone lactonase YvrE